MGGEKLAERSQVWTVTNEATKEENTEIFVLFAVLCPTTKYPAGGSRCTATIRLDHQKYFRTKVIEIINEEVQQNICWFF